MERLFIKQRKELSRTPVLLHGPEGLCLALEGDLWWCKESFCSPTTGNTHKRVIRELMQRWRFQRKHHIIGVNEQHNGSARASYILVHFLRCFPQNNVKCQE